MPADAGQNGAGHWTAEANVDVVAGPVRQMLRNPDGGGRAGAGPGACRAECKLVNQRVRIAGVAECLHQQPFGLRLGQFAVRGIVARAGQPASLWSRSPIRWCSWAVPCRRPAGRPGEPAACPSLPRSATLLAVSPPAGESRSRPCQATRRPARGELRRRKTGGPRSAAERRIAADRSRCPPRGPALQPQFEGRGDPLRGGPLPSHVAATRPPPGLPPTATRNRRHRRSPGGRRRSPSTADPQPRGSAGRRKNPVSCTDSHRAN